MEGAFERIQLGENERDANGNMKPHFFRIIVDPSHQLHRLRLPPKFSRESGSSMLAYAYLRAPEGEEHTVKVIKARDGDIWFTRGWNDFVTTYSLEYGSFLVFRYEGNSRFHVFIFDTSCIEIDYENFGIEDEPEAEDVDDQDEDEDDDDNNNRAKERAKAFRSEDGNPFFVANMRAAYLRGDYRLWVAARHAKQYLLSAETDTLQLELAEPREDGEKRWMVTFTREPGRPGRKTVVRISGGWKSFAIDNGLRVQDVCVFELVNRDPMTYRVHIFRN